MKYKNVELDADLAVDIVNSDADVWHESNIIEAWQHLFDHGIVEHSSDWHKETLQTLLNNGLIYNYLQKPTETNINRSKDGQQQQQTTKE